ncbi:MAG: hypothetical protein M3481_02160 [Actinomycetota bacterium]|nr:hypothetical protein [Actinomycetota bacterium]
MSESRDEMDPADGPPEEPTAGKGGETPDEVDTAAGPQLQEEPEDADSPEVSSDGPGPGGYAGRDPKTEMPRVPSAPETQDDPKSHDAAP